MVVVASAKLLVSQLARLLAQLETRVVRILTDKTLVSKTPLRGHRLLRGFSVWLYLLNDRKRNNLLHQYKNNGYNIVLDVN